MAKDDDPSKRGKQLKRKQWRQLLQQEAKKQALMAAVYPEEVTPSPVTPVLPVSAVIPSSGGSPGGPVTEAVLQPEVDQLQPAKPAGHDVEIHCRGSVDSSESSGEEVDSDDSDEEPSDEASSSDEDELGLEEEHDLEHLQAQPEFGANVSELSTCIIVRQRSY